jgi:membrane-bound ClpP family serine protease
VTIVWALLLLVLAVALIVLELFIPSSGVLSILSAASLIASIVMVFYYWGLGAGTAYLAFTALLTPLVIYTAIRWWPYTPIGRRILNLPPEEEREIVTSPTHDLFRHLVGKEGSAVSKMLPSGIVRIEGKTYDAVSEGMAIDAGQLIEVVEVEGNRIVVRPLDSALADDRASSDDPLSRPVDETIPDPFRDPLA